MDGLFMSLSCTLRRKSESCEEGVITCRHLEHWYRIEMFCCKTGLPQWTGGKTISRKLRGMRSLFKILVGVTIYVESRTNFY
jgi:hypothetical protein